jgi:hypothetical protein
MFHACRLEARSKAPWIGVSNFNVQQLQRAQPIASATSLQPWYSLMQREIEDEILLLPEGRNWAIVYSPMASGLLTGAIPCEGAAIYPKMTGAGGMPTLRNQMSHNMVLVERMRAIANRHKLRRRSRNCLDAAPSRRDRRHRRCPQYAPGRRSRARSRVAPQRDRSLGRDRGLTECGATGGRVRRVG